MWHVEAKLSKKVRCRSECSRYYTGCEGTFAGLLFCWSCLLLWVKKKVRGFSHPRSKNFNLLWRASRDFALVSSPLFSRETLKRSGSWGWGYNNRVACVVYYSLQGYTDLIICNTFVQQYTEWDTLPLSSYYILLLLKVPNYVMLHCTMHAYRLVQISI